MAPQVGLEPTTLRLTAECSTIELLRSNGVTFKLTNASDQCQCIEMNFARELKGFLILVSHFSGIILFI